MSRRTPRDWEQEDKWHEREYRDRYNPSSRMGTGPIDHLAPLPGAALHDDYIPSRPARPRGEVERSPSPAPRRRTSEAETLEKLARARGAENRDFFPYSRENMQLDLQREREGHHREGAAFARRSDDLKQLNRLLSAEIRIQEGAAGKDDEELKRTRAERRRFEDHLAREDALEDLKARLERVDVVWHNKDVTVHFELDAVEDLEPDLEDLSRLCKLGNLRAAKEFFAKKLGHHKKNPFVLVQYAQMLMEMGDYKSVKALEVPFGWAESVAMIHTAPNRGQPYYSNFETRTKHELLWTNWKMIEIFCALHDGSVIEKDAIDHAHKANSLLRNKGVVDEFGTTHFQIFVLSIHIIAHAYRYHTNMVVGSDIEEFGWRDRYREILTGGRIWDFKDLFAAALLWSKDFACTRFFSLRFGSAVVLDRLIADWAMADYEESTNLALLDTLTSLALSSPLSAENFTGVRHCVDYAQVVASTILRNDPVNLKSRQYFRFILAKVLVITYQDVSAYPGSRSKLPGIFLKAADALGFSIYVPASSEVPDWHLPNHPSETVETVQMVLNAARELADYQTESLCLKQLVKLSSDPAKYFDELIHLQRTVQNDNCGCLETCLAKYAICQDEDSRGSLRVEILSLSDCEKFDSPLRWARSMVLRSLSNSKDEADSFLQEARSVSFFDHVPENIRAFMERHFFADKMQQKASVEGVGNGSSGKRALRQAVWKEVSKSKDRPSEALVEYGRDPVIGPASGRQDEETSSVGEDREQRGRRTRLNTGERDESPQREEVDESKSEKKKAQRERRRVEREEHDRSERDKRPKTYMQDEDAATYQQSAVVRYRPKLQSSKHHETTPSIEEVITDPEESVRSEREYNGRYFPETNYFPPPPTGEHYPAYNPADYPPPGAIPPPHQKPYGYAPPVQEPTPYGNNPGHDGWNVSYHQSDNETTSTEVGETSMQGGSKPSKQARVDPEEAEGTSEPGAEHYVDKPVPARKKNAKTKRKKNGKLKLNTAKLPKPPSPTVDEVNDDDLYA